ncbi:hypothetical protein [Deinococcus hopiensis]|uniref:Uncharacterized protein n=1 Tax=Deinococcus hopiensis KR-140 TaxID=695939 RepID=A0A1W1V5Q0_9DEIO|nr:hypothetical protein [Deinococcus hopiensis]SMB88678.1 hypothetical protein SAMN00790413_00135 [Deinococcus hopiensis KR-140]
MLKAGGYALIAFAVFALVFALLPVSRVAGAQTGATLSGVALSLYPSRDADAVWRFRAASVTNDPLTGETRLTGLSEGGRWITERDKAGQPTGRRVLDATLAAPDLTIDSQDNLSTHQALITLVKECAAIQLTGTPQQPVRVEQGNGFSAPLTKIDAPSLKAEIPQLRMGFDFVIQDAGPSTVISDLDVTETCENGKRVSHKPSSRK